MGESLPDYNSFTDFLHVLQDRSNRTEIWLDGLICSCELSIMPAKKKFRPVVHENAQSREAIRGRGASWSPANRFERLHVDVNDFDVVDVDPDGNEQPRRVT